MTCTRGRAPRARYWSAYGIPAAARYLAWLAEHTSYGLSDIEAEVAAHAAVRPAERPGRPSPAGPDSRSRTARTTPAHHDQPDASDGAENDTTAQRQYRLARPANPLNARPVFPSGRAFAYLPRNPGRLTAPNFSVYTLENLACTR